ncbi:winged helix-turn-helix domain-containing protein [Shewanella submarina]|uniref:Winged helix-turn-helix domain-containing protein n=1 Tax=Shewanella submarina TaxID=2016376 RepID=A0ABV7GHY7_9GAMM|nr:winged helix-turn-helix domain-containing protein [Shewanella submarina]MCL1035583.1 winged helix-turn-helix domain-containing protein [Shewanella submarina]
MAYQMDRVEFGLGEWQVLPATNKLARHGRAKSIEPKAMEVLLLLCARPGELVTTEQLLDSVWPAFESGDNPLHKVINQLRRALGDSASNPSYIETIRGKGYRILADIQLPQSPAPQPELASSWAGKSPFPGLQAYSQAYSDLFFGRERALDALLERIVRQVRYGRAFCLVLGPSGCGKSSLLQAGVLPRLALPEGVDGVAVLSHVTVDFADVEQGMLFMAVASAMLDWELEGEGLFPDESAFSLSEKLRNNAGELLKDLKKRLPRVGPDMPRLALVVDRLEVLLTSREHSRQDRTAFIELLETLAGSGAVLVLSACRNEFYPELVSFPTLSEGRARGAQFDLAQASRAELARMIRLPARAAGLEWQTDPESGLTLDELLVEEAANYPDALPMLQYTLEALYLGKQGNTLLVSCYQALGGLEGAIGQTAEQTISQLPKKDAEALPRVLSLLVSFREDEETLTSRSARFSALQTDAERRLVDALVTARLFVAHLYHGERCFRIAHEALLRRWHRASEWINQHQDALKSRARLSVHTRRWLDEKRSRNYLLPHGKPLQEAQELRADPLLVLTESELTYIRESERRERLLQLSKIAIAASLLLLTCLSAYMGFQSQQAEQRATEKRLAAENLLGFMVGDFADKLRGIGRMDLLDGISNKALEYFSRPDWDEGVGFDARFQHGQTLEAIGEVAYSRGKTDEAKQALLTARAQLLVLLQVQPENLKLLKTLGANAFWLGQLEYDNSDWDATRPWFKAYLDHSEAMVAAAPQDFDALLELSYAQSSLGSLALKRMDFDSATINFETALVTQERLLQLQPDNEQLLANTANTQSWLATSKVHQGQISAGIQLYEQIDAALERDKDAYIKDRRSYLLEKLADLYFYKSEVQKGKLALNTAFALRYEVLKEDPNNLLWVYELALLEVSRLLHGLVPHEDLNTVSDIERRLNIDTTQLSAVRQDKLAALLSYAKAKQYLLSGDDAEALAASHIAVDLLSKLHVESSADTSLLSDLSAAKMLLLTIEQSHFSQVSQALCFEVEASLAVMIDKSMEPRLLAPYIKALECLGEGQKLESLKQRLARQGELPSVYL